DKAAYDNYVEVEYARARTLFEAHRWPEAAAAFRTPALARTDHEAGIYAAQLYLEALNVMASHGTPSCFDDMARDLPELWDKHCGAGRGKANAEQCAILGRVRRDLEWKRLDLRALRLQGTGPDRAKDFEEVAVGFLDLWTTYGKDACEAKQPGC